MTAQQKQLPANPNITHLKRQAKDLQAGVAASEPEALERVRTFHPRHAPNPGHSKPGAPGAAAPAVRADDGFDPGSFTLRDAQATLAREYGFDGWHQLNTEVGERMVDERDLHRWFGVQLNNGMWDSIEDPAVGPDTPREERELLLYSAYASAYHWRRVGDAANQARGEHLIARMAVKVGEAEIALRHARRCLELVETNTEVMADWDLPFAHEALARALAATGDRDAAVAHRAEAERLTAAVAGEGDRQVLQGELAREPWFGLIGS